VLVGDGRGELRGLPSAVSETLAGASVAVVGSLGSLGPPQPLAPRLKPTSRAAQAIVRGKRAGMSGIPKKSGARHPVAMKAD